MSQSNIFPLSSCSLTVAEGYCKRTHFAT